MKHRPFRLFFRILVTTAALVWFFSAVRLESLLDRLSHVLWWVVALAFLVNSAWVVPCAIRWKGIARFCGYPLPFRASARYYVIGTFFNSFLPTGNGGDVVRGYLATREYGCPLGGIWGTILVERIIGMMVSLCLVIITGFTIFSGNFVPRNVLVSAAVLFACTAAAGVLLTSGKFRRFIRPVLKKLLFRPFLEGARDFSHVMESCRENPRAMGSAVLFTFANQFIHILSGFVMSLAILDFKAPFVAFLVVIPLSFISVLLPSIGGYGVRESGTLLFFGWFGVQKEPAAVFGILRLLFLWSFSLGGAVLYILDKHDKKKNGISSTFQWNR
jgi:uncharacterized protein (TIRG00374 family)